MQEDDKRRIRGGHTLLVNSTYEPIGFLSTRRAMKLLAKGKVDVLECWTGSAVVHGAGSVQLPALMRLRVRAPHRRQPPRFQRRTMFERDAWTCQYCGAPLTRRTATVDHLIPRARGGRTSWLNCVTSCLTCNKRKGDTLVEHFDGHLASRPTLPTARHIWQADVRGEWHETWDQYVSHDI